MQVSAYNDVQLLRLKRHVSKASMSVTKLVGQVEFRPVLA